MSIPSDRLYHFLDSAIEDDLLIYRWFPYGSKNLRDLTALHPYTILEQLIRPLVICHDQEVLDHNHYCDTNIVPYFVEDQDIIRTSTSSVPPYQARLGQNIRSLLPYRHNIFQQQILLHSERNSQDLAKYQQIDMIPVYIWSHYLLARDWYRYAEHDRDLAPSHSDWRWNWLIYSRAWSGSREYRLTFLEMLLQANQHGSALVRFADHDQGRHYTDHVWHDKRLKITRQDLQHRFEPNTNSSACSAEYDAENYQQCAVEIVLETVFNTTTQHLTEKVLRPIACAKPFLLVGSAGSLELLKEHGFITFHPLIDETYDQINDPLERLKAIVLEIKRINCMPAGQRTDLFIALHSIAKQNQKLFFGRSILNTITNNFQKDMAKALITMIPNAYHIRDYLAKVEQWQIPLSQNIWQKFRDSVWQTRAYWDNHGLDYPSLRLPSQSSSTPLAAQSCTRSAKSW